jgi:hypothetical protein
MHLNSRIAIFGSETVCGRDAAAEPPRMGSQRVEESNTAIRLFHFSFQE